MPSWLTSPTCNASWSVANHPAVNASPLIFLIRAGLLDLLRLAALEIVVPAPVAHEIQRRGPGDPTAQAIASVNWLHVIDVEQVPEVIQAWDLGPGESAVLS